MTNLIIAVVALLLALAGVVVRKTYFALPSRELKRRAAKHERPAAQLYRAVAYGSSLHTLLWLYIGLMSAASLVLLARLLPIWASLLVVGPLLWIAFSLLPATRTTRLGIRLTVLLTPLIAWLLDYLHPSLSRSAVAVKQRYTVSSHTGIFEREDLLELIERQQSQTDNRLSNEELEIIKRALSFEDYKVGDIMTSRKRVKTVLADDTVGPILIDEVHKSGQDFALVRASQKGEFIGSLATTQLNLKSAGRVHDIMLDKIYYLHEEDSLRQALHAFFVTNHALFVVVNSAEDYVGVLTITDVLKQLMGHVPGDDFDQYADMPAVAARHHVNQKPRETDEFADPAEETPVKTDDEVIE
jgi:CBS domain containing-hemolysin-like protein